MFLRKPPQPTISSESQQKEKQNHSNTFAALVAFRIPDMMQHFGEELRQEGSIREKETMAETRLAAWWFISAFSTIADSKVE